MCESFVISPPKLLILTYPETEPNSARQRLPKHSDTLKCYMGSLFASVKKADRRRNANKRVSSTGIDNEKKNTTNFNLQRVEPLCVYTKNYHTKVVQV